MTVTAATSTPSSSSQNSNNSNTPEDDNNNQWPAAKLWQASYKDLGSPSQVEDRFLRHLLAHCRPHIETLLYSTSSTSRDYSMPVDFFDLAFADPVLGFLLLRYPSTLLPVLESAIVLAQQQQQQQQQERQEHGHSGIGGAGIVKGANLHTRVHARLVHLPPTCCRPNLASLTGADCVGKIWQIHGIVVRTGPVQMYESTRCYKCLGAMKTSMHPWAKKQKSTNKNNNGNKNKQDETAAMFCRRTFQVHADLEQRNNALKEPETCPGVLPSGERCTGNQFEIVESGSIHTDYQEIKVQDASSNMGGGNHSLNNNNSSNIPRSILVKLQHDLVDQCQPGDEVVIVGILLAQWQSTTVPEGVECEVGMAMMAHSVRVIAEKGASAWKPTNSTNSSLNNHPREIDNYQKEFEQYWRQPSSIERPIAARDFICKAVCPKLYGMQIIKLALLITLIGGVSSVAYEDQRQGTNTTKNDTSHDEFEPDAFRLTSSEDQIYTTDGTANSTADNYFGDVTTTNRSSNRMEQVKTRRRNSSHILLVGDPGTGKSQFLRFAAALCPRSVLTTGVGTTSAGLTCAAVREGSGKEFALEAGALVLADKGVCCIDEFGCIREADRTTIHEAMEQQTLSVAKGGIVCKLNCRATIVAVMNPRDSLYDNHTSLSVNTGLGTPLLSRFDLIFKLVEPNDAERDSNVTNYLLSRAIQGAGFDVVELGTGGGHGIDHPWSMEKLRAYISVVKERFVPVMSDDAAMLLERHYQKCRSAQSNTIPVTVRFLESLIRLSQAHSRLMHRESNTVTLQDAVAVIQIMESTAFAYGGFDGVSVEDYQNVMYRDPITIDFSSNPDEDFLCFEYRILQRYDMLRFMDDERRNRALLSLGMEADDGGDSWADVENHIHQKQVTNVDPSQDTFSSSLWQGTGCNVRNEWCGSGDGGDQNVVRHIHVSQDHYGRFQFDSLTQTHNKRARR